jgi:hypothetical protein
MQATVAVQWHCVCSMWMPVVDVGEVRVFVHHRLMPMPVLVGLVAGPCEHMRVLMVRVMDMAVTVLHRLMGMFTRVRQLRSQVLVFARAHFQKCHYSSANCSGAAGFSIPKA